MERDPNERKPRNLDELMARISEDRTETPPLPSNIEANVLRAIRMEQARREEGASPQYGMNDAWWDISHQKGLVGYGLVLSAILSLALAQTQENSPMEDSNQDVRGASSFLLSELDPWERLLRSHQGPQVVD